MGRLATALRLPRKPDFLQHIPARQAYSHLNGKEKAIRILHTELLMDGCYILLLFFNLVTDKDGSTKGSTANLLHDFVLIHARFHEPQSVTKQSGSCSSSSQQVCQSLNTRASHISPAQAQQGLKHHHILIELCKTKHPARHLISQAALVKAHALSRGVQSNPPRVPFIRKEKRCCAEESF